MKPCKKVLVQETTKLLEWPDKERFATDGQGEQVKQVSRKGVEECLQQITLINNINKDVE